MSPSHEREVQSVARTGRGDFLSGESASELAEPHPHDASGDHAGDQQHVLDDQVENDPLHLGRELDRYP